MPDSARNTAPGAPIPTEPDISLHRAGLLPAAAAGDEAGNGGEPAAPPLPPYWLDHLGDGPAYDPVRECYYTAEELHALRAGAARKSAAAERRRRDDGPEERWSKWTLGADGIMPPAGESCAIERRTAEEEQDYLKGLARTRPPLENRTAGRYLREFNWVRPCRGKQRNGRRGTVTNPDIS